MIETKQQKPTSKAGKGLNLTPVVSRDGQALFNSYVNDLKESQPNLLEFTKQWESVKDVVGPFDIGWLQSVLSNTAWSKMEEIIKSQSLNKEAHEREDFINHYTEEMYSLKQSFEDTLNLLRTKVSDYQYPHTLRKLNGVLLLKEGGFDLREESLIKIRPLFDDILTDPSDIELYHLLFETAGAVEKLITELKKRKFAVWGTTYTRMFTHSNDGKVEPVTYNLKHKLSLLK